MNEEKHLTGLNVTQAKKAYVKPVLSEVRLVAEEAVLALCKFGTGNQSACIPDRFCISTPRS
jgi:hypothetical protein